MTSRPPPSSLDKSSNENININERSATSTNGSTSNGSRAFDEADPRSRVFQAKDPRRSQPAQYSDQHSHSYSHMQSNGHPPLPPAMMSAMAPPSLPQQQHLLQQQRPSPTPLQQRQQQSQQQLQEDALQDTQSPDASQAGAAQTKDKSPSVSTSLNSSHVRDYALEEETKEGDPVAVEPDVELIEDVEWGSADQNSLYGELATKPKPDPIGDPCGCGMPAHANPNSAAASPCDIEPCCCMDPSCILFACQEECRSNCEAGPYCGNKRIQKKLWRQVEVFNAGPKGRGLRVMEDVKKGDFLLEYVGKAVRASYLSKLFQRYKQERRLYIMALDSNTYLDARKRGGVARYINHSCEPNCVVERWKVRGIIRAGIFALKDINRGEELSFDYQWERKKGRAPTKCYCGTPTCRGTLEVPKSLDEQEFEKTAEGHWNMGTKHAGREIINRSIRILSQEHQQYFYADVCKYDERNHKHLVIYRHDWEELWEDLSKEEWQLLDEDVGQEFVIAKKQATISRHRKLVASPDTKGGASLLAKIGAGDKDIEELRAIKPYLYVQTPIKDLFFAKHLIERCERNCRVTIQAKQFAKPPMPPDPNDPDDVEKHKALEESQDGTVWKLTISGYNVAKACTILERNATYLTKQLEGEPLIGPGGVKKPNALGINRGVAFGADGSAVPDSDKFQEVVMPRLIVDNFKRRLPYVREKCRSVNITFAPSESKSKQFAKLLLEGSLQSDMQVARDQVWTHLNAACTEMEAPKAVTGIYRDLGFMGGELTGEQFRLLLQNEKNRQSQDCREDLRRSSFFASFESTQRCTVWVQSDEDKGRIDSSNHIVGVPTPFMPRKIFFGCDPKEINKLWTLVQTRASEVARGVKYLYLGADRVYQPFMMKHNFFAYVQRVTGASVMVDQMTGDHLRIDGRRHHLPTSAVIDVDWKGNDFSESERVLLAQELIRLQIEIYRDHCIRQQNWIFGRDWTLATIATTSTTETFGSDASPLTSYGVKSSNATSRLVFDEKTIANACQEIADIVSTVGLDVSVAASSSIIFYRFITTVCQNESFDTQLKVREILLACVFLANKAQKLVKWKRLDAILEAAYQVFYPGARFDRSKEEAMVLGDKVLLAETEMLTALDYDIFWRGVEWILSAAVEAGIKEPLAKTALNTACSGPVLAAGSTLWLRYGMEYVFAAAAGFLEADLEELFPALSLIPLKVFQAGELIAESMKFSSTSKRNATHTLFDGGKEEVLRQLPRMKEVCVKCMAVGFGQQVMKSASETCQRFRRIGGRDSRRHVIRDVPRNLMKEFILPAIDGASADSNCNIYIGQGSNQIVDDIVLEGSWRAVAIAERLLRSTVEQGSLPPAVDITVELAVSNTTKLQAKAQPGLLSMNNIDSSDGWNETIQSEVSIQSGWRRKTGGKVCVAAKVAESALRDVGLRWWIPPQHGPSPTGSICDMFLIRSNPKDQFVGLSRLSQSILGESKFLSKPSKQASEAKSISSDRYVAVSLQRWPSQKVENREIEKSNKKTNGIVNMGIGFSAAALQEMQLLTELHSIIPSPQGHPNFVLPISLALAAVEEDENNSRVEAEAPLSTVADDIFSLFRTSEENEKVAGREKKRKEMVTGPHLVFQPSPFVLQRFMSRKKKKAFDDNGDQSLSPAIFSAWFHDLLSALVHCHTNHVILRHFQADQIVIDQSGVAKIGGLYRASVLSPEDRKEAIDPVKVARARKKGKKADDDDEAASNPYAAPENLLGSLKQTKESDVWSLGCLLAHVLINKQLFVGKDRQALLTSMYKVVGSPSKDNYEQAVRFPLFSKPHKKYKRGVVKALQHMMKAKDCEQHAGALDLLSQMLHLDPKKRITATEALQHQYMLDYVESCNSKAFQEQFVEDWMALKGKLMTATRSEEDHARNKERSLKRKAVLMAASNATKDDQEDLYNLDELFDIDTKKPRL